MMKAASVKLNHNIKQMEKWKSGTENLENAPEDFNKGKFGYLED